jgi:polyisoprenyl-teichoic acid--peptidoglycan teichoic acid transferase
MHLKNWSSVFISAGLAGVLLGYIATLILKPSLLPPLLRIGSLHEPTNVLFLGTDVVYSEGNRKKKSDKEAFTGRSDTIMLAHLDPYRNTFGVVSIPRDTQAAIPGYGVQKINAANAYGGPDLTVKTVASLLELPVDHYVVLNLHGLVELVDELGGITLEIPKRMRYMDWTAKLKIDLDPGYHTLTGNQAMGFVRFRHDALGDIGRVQRQQIFVRAVLDKAIKPESWSHLPKLIEIADRYIKTDMNMGDLIGIAAFVRAVPKENQFLAMLPGTFSGTGDWLVEGSDIRRMVARLTGASFVTVSRGGLRVAIINASSNDSLGLLLSKKLRAKGYTSVFLKSNDQMLKPLRRSRFIAQRGNPEDAVLVKEDLDDCGDVVSASVGDIESAVTILAGDDLAEHLPVRVGKTYRRQ